MTIFITLKLSSLCTHINTISSEATVKMLLEKGCIFNKTVVHKKKRVYTKSFQINFDSQGFRGLDAGRAEWSQNVFCCCFHFLNKSQSAARPFCCEAPEMLCGQQTLSRLSSDVGVSRHCLNLFNDI